MRLNEEQRAVAAWRPAHGDLRVAAGAGTGKTTAVLALVEALIEDEVEPHEIVVTTFTSKAAQELTKRDPSLKWTRCGTFHSLGLKELRDAELGEWNLSHCLDIPPKGRRVPSAWSLWNAILGYGGRGGVPGLGCRGLDIDKATPPIYARFADLCRAEMLDPATQAHDGPKGFGPAWKMFCEAKRELDAWEFADVLDAWLLALREGAIDSDAAAVIVDEAQDNSAIQLEIARLLAQQGALALVGDSRQAIFTWRGARPSIFIESPAKLLPLSVNYRSGYTIVELANRTAAGQPWAVGGDIVAATDAPGAVVVQGFETDVLEAAGVADQIGEALEAGAALSDFAILCRTNAQLLLYEAELVERAIPYAITARGSVWACAAAQDLLAYIHLFSDDDRDSAVRLLRARKFLGRRFEEQFYDALRDCDDVVEALAFAAERARWGIQAAGRSLVRDISEVRDSEHFNEACLAAAELVKEARRVEDPKAKKLTDADISDEEELIDRLANRCARFDGPAELFDFVGRCVDGAKSHGRYGSAEDADCVTLSTIHRAKGLEWSVVFVDATRDVLPHRRADTDEQRAEERRLFYVAVTRPRDRLVLTYHDRVGDFDRGPSHFLGMARDLHSPEADR